MDMGRRFLIGPALQARSGPTPLETISILALVVVSAFAILVAIHAWNDWRDSMLIEFRNATGERLCYVWGEDCTEIKPRAPSYGDFGSCPIGVTITTQDGEEIYSRVFNCDDIDLSDLLILINKRDGEFVVLDNAP
jgi:hypothetical protein